MTMIFNCFKFCNSRNIVNKRVLSRSFTHHKRINYIHKLCQIQFNISKCIISRKNDPFIPYCGTHTSFLCTHYHDIKSSGDNMLDNNLHGKKYQNKTFEKIKEIQRMNEDPQHSHHDNSVVREDEKKDQKMINHKKLKIFVLVSFLTFSLGISTMITLFIYEQSKIMKEYESDKEDHGAIYDEEHLMDMENELSNIGFENEKRNIFRRMINGVYLVIRSMQLCLYFTPLIISLPILRILFPSNYDQYWYQILLKTFQIAGPCFIKVGQWMASRPDLFPDELCHCMSQLHSSAPMHSFEDTKRIFKETFEGKIIEQVFEKFDANPIASGAIAQIYRARYNGTNVAVKVVHPGVESSIYNDLRILQKCCKLLGYIPLLSWLNLEENVIEFSKLMRQQVDLSSEGQNLKVFNSNFAKYPNILFPIPYFASKKVLIESFEPGLPIMSFVKQNLLNDEKKAMLASAGVTLYLKMMVVDNFVHSDLHPGNILTRLNASGNPELIVLDAGLVTILSPKERRNFIDLFSAVVLGNGERAAELMIERARYKNRNQTSPKDKEGFKRELVPIINHVVERPLSEIELGKVMGEVLRISRKYCVPVESKFTSLVLGTVVLEGVGKQLNPSLNFIAEAKPIFAHSPHLVLHEAKLVEAYFRRMIVDTLEKWRFMPLFSSEVELMDGFC